MQPMETNIDEEREKEFMKEAMKMNIMIVGICIFILSIFLLYDFPLFIKVGSVALVVVSLYYQLKAYKEGIGSGGMIGMKVQERMINEMGYQASKRGYKILFEYVIVNNDEKVKVKETNIPTKFKKKMIKWISIAHVILKPAWGYREFDEEDEIDEVLNESWYKNKNE